jgi:hypothetical protein
MTLEMKHSASIKKEKIKNKKLEKTFVLGRRKVIIYDFVIPFEARLS